MGEFVASIERSKAKNVSASGGLRPLTPDQGLCPWTPLRASPSDPRYRLALCALAIPPSFCQVLHTPLPTCILERDRNELEKQHLRQQRWSRTFQ